MKTPDTHVFISDLHLQPDESATLDLAVDFLRQIPDGASLYILGDLFDYWIGDDAMPGALRPFAIALKALGDRGTDVHLMHGNRDFLLGEQFAADVGATLHRGDTLAVTLGDTPALLMHGDTLCTDDVDYQRLRLRLREGHWQRDFLALPRAERDLRARRMRTDSRQASLGKASSITDVNAQAVERAFTDSACDWLIHGHTHRPADHDLQAHGRSRRRLVLGDWHASGAWVARWQHGTLALLRIAA